MYIVWNVYCLYYIIGVWTPAWPSSTLPGGLWGWCCSWWRAEGSVSSGKYFSLWISKIILCRQEEGQGAGGGGQRGVRREERELWNYLSYIFQEKCDILWLLLIKFWLFTLIYNIQAVTFVSHEIKSKISVNIFMYSLLVWAAMF